MLIQTRCRSRTPIRVEEVLDNELLQLLVVHQSPSVLIDDLHVGGDVGRGGFEALIHGPVAVDEPLAHLDGLALPVMVGVVGVDDASI